MATPTLSSGSSAVAVRPSAATVLTLTQPAPAAACAKLLYPLQNSPWPSQQHLLDHVHNPNSQWRLMHRQALDELYRAGGEPYAQAFYGCVLQGLIGVGVPLTMAVMALRNDYTAVVSALKAEGVPAQPEPPVVYEPSVPSGPRLPVPLPTPPRPNGYPPEPGHTPPQPGSGPGPSSEAGSHEQFVPIVIVSFAVALAGVGVALWLRRK